MTGDKGGSRTKLLYCMNTITSGQTKLNAIQKRDILCVVGWGGVTCDVGRTGRAHFASTPNKDFFGVDSLIYTLGTRGTGDRVAEMFIDALVVHDGRFATEALIHVGLDSFSLSPCQKGCGLLDA
jgi:hypothetical protein